VFNRLLLLARGVNSSAMRDEYGAMLCHHVARNFTSEDDLRFLVNFCGKDAIHAVDNYGATPLHRASSSGNDSAVRVLVELGADIDRQSNWGSALINAADSSRSSCVELLVALGADVDVVMNTGQTACHIAARYCHRRALCALVAAGGDLDQLDSNGETPRMIATRLEFHCRQLTRSMLRAIESQRLASIWFANVHSKSVSACNLSDSMHCNCAKS
jgi:ankyrin repeat protein